MKDYYLLVGLNSKEIKIIDVNQRGNGLIEVEIESKKKKARCPVCNKFTISVHSKLKPIRSNYLDSCGSSVDLIIHKKRYHCYKCDKIFTEELNLNSNKGNISNKVKIQIRKDLLNYNLSLKYIAEKNKYAFILNDPIHKKVLDVLPSRKKERLMQYFTYCKNRHSVEFVISDMYEPYLLVTQTMFPKAKYVALRYHYTTYIMDR